MNEINFNRNKEVTEGEPEPQVKTLLLGILKQIQMGLPISRVIIPCEFLEPRSLLERLSDLLTHSDILLKATEFDDPLQRMVEVIRWNLSGFHIAPKGVKKPYNPVLGEVFRCNFVMPDGSILTYFAEQVSHHPPISAFYGECKQKHIVAGGWYAPTSHYMGNSGCSMTDGMIRIHFLKRKETYETNFPNVYFRGILFGKFFMELCGDTTLRCKETGLEAKTQFKAKPMFGGEKNHVESKIINLNFKKPKTVYRIKGKYDEKLYIKKRTKKTTKNSKTEENGVNDWDVLFDAINHPRMQKGVPAFNEQKPYESQQLWKDLTSAILNGDIKKASEAKFKVENEQRQKKAEMDRLGITYKPKFFKKGEGKFWDFIGHNSEEYLELLKPIGQQSDEQKK